MEASRFATAFGDAAAEYERGRPGYPDAAIEALARELELGRRAVVVDLAAGTGKLTRDLAGRFERVVAIEPLDEMRAQLAACVPLDGLASRSYVAVLDPDDRAAVLDAVAALLERPDAPVEAGRVVVPMRTACYWTRLTAPP